MKQWWQWFLLSGVWLLAAVLNYVEGRNFVVIGYNLFAVLLFTALGFLQRACDRKGDVGKRMFKRITVAAVVLIILVFAVLLLAF